MLVSVGTQGVKGVYIRGILAPYLGHAEEGAGLAGDEGSTRLKGFEDNEALEEAGVTGEECVSFPGTLER